MSSAETKKPPVAPKPRLVIGHKIVPPPVAPKPEVVVVDVLQSSRKTKPVIAPKPKVLKCSTVPELKTAPTSIRRNLKTLEDHKKDSSEYLVHLNYKNGIPTDNAAYIISLCSCNFECIHKCGNREDTHKNATIFEQLENLENINIDEQPSSSLKRGTIFESNNENNLNNYKVVLKANDLEEKLEDVMIQNVYPNNGHLRQKHLSKYQTVNAVNSNKNVKIEFSPPISNVEEFKESSSNDAKLTAVESEMLEVPLLTENNNNCFSLSNPAHMEKMDVNNTSMISCTKDNDKLSCGTNSVVSTKPFPVPKPRKLHTPCLVRQDGIDASGEDECDSSGIHEFAIKNTTKINVLVQSVSYKNQEHQSAVDKSEVASYSVRKVHSTSESTDAKELIPQSQLSEIAHEHCPFLENIGHSSDLNSIKPSINIMEDNSMLATDAKETGFVRCSNLSMSLPKQIKLSCNQTLPALVTLDDSAQKKEAKDVYLKGESSSRIIPKKPQRRGIAVAGLLKKSASEELLDTSAYFSSENKTLEAPLERPRIRHFSAREQNTVLLCDTPTSSSEKPIWKLPHPILPFSRNPETLKNTKNAKKVENFSTVTKPRAKSLSSVDMDRIHKPPKEPQKKSSLKKFLNMKWSVWMLKSDFQKFLAKGTQSTDNANGDIPSGEEPGKNGNAIAMANGRKAKPAKAHSAEMGSFFSQKGKQKIRAQNEIKINQRSKSLDEQTFSLQGHLTSVTQDNTHEYENVSHYEEIPEYENLPFAATDENICFDRQNSSIVENQDTNMYEVEELYEPTGSCLEFGRSSAERDGSELMLEDIHSDDEIMPRDVNSSDEDEDDTNSDSSKGESDAQENKQFRASGKKTKVYHIAKEIMSSEKVFVDVLKLLHIDFRDSVAHASRQFGKPVIEDKVLNQILYYLPQLYELNRDLLRELEERLSHWIDHQRIADIFVKKGPYLKMYSTYIKEFDRNVALLDEHCKKNPGFAAVVREFEMSPRCANLALKHYLLKPVQRIPQYRLLLTDYRNVAFVAKGAENDYLKNLLEDSADFKDTQDALAVVIEVANHANDIMKQGDNFQKLMQIQYSLTGHHEIVQPGRVFLKEGTLMKLSRKVMQPRMFFLFNDTLLYTTPLQSGMYKLNNMLSLAGMKVKKPTHEAYQNELNIESVERSFILSANSATERDEWLETISQSIEDYTKKRITFNPTKSLEEADQEKEEERPVGSKAPIWIPDTRATMCMICTSEFTLTWRRHHCRACGKIICQACSSNKHGLDYMKNHPARVCDHCFKELQKQDNMYTSKNGSPLNHRSPTNALSTVLHSIPSGRKQKKIPAALKEVSANTEDSSISGYLYRSKGAKKPWKHLWFVIKNKVLYTYAASEDVAALESQPLLGFTVAEVKDEHLESKVFHLLHKNTLFYIFRSDDSQSTQRWIEAFQEATIL